MNKLIPTKQLEINTIQMKLPLDVGIKINISDPVVTFKEVMEGVNLNKYLIKDSTETRGRDGYDPKVLLKIVLFAFMINVRSTRKIESLCRNDIRFMYLSDEITPSHMTICNFINDYLIDSIENISNDIVSYIIKKQNIDQIICLGDIIGKGVNAHECIKLVRKHADIVIMGNVDERFCENPEEFKDDKLEHMRIEFNQSLMTAEDMDYLRSLPYSTEFYLSGNLVRMYHSNPKSFKININHFDTNFKKKLKMFEPGEFTISNKIADLVVFGHLHYQFMEKFYNRTLVNCGSVGNSGCLIHDEKYNAEPREIVQAHYLILEGELDSEDKSDELSIIFRSVNYDIEKELNSGLNNPEFEDYEKELKKARYRNIQREKETLKTFGYKFEDEN